MENRTNSGPVFLVGVWRSGTSLLHALLNQHPGIGLLYEAELPLLRTLFLPSGVKRDWLDRWDFWNGALTRHGLTAGEFSPKTTNLRSAVENVYRAFAERRGATIWGEKSPNYWDRMDWIFRVFPDARFIVVFRDPHLVCRSVIEAGEEDGYFAKRGMPLRALLACELLKSQADRLRRLGAPLHVLQYEDLVKNPAVVLSGICEFLGLPFEPKMATLSGADRRGFYEGSHHALAKGDRVVEHRKRKDVVPSEFTAKIDGYIAYWRRKYQGEWPLHPAPGMRAASEPGWTSRLADGIAFWLLRRFDALVATLFCWAPLGWLRRYRESKGSQQPPPPEQFPTDEEVTVRRGPDK